MAVVKVPIGNVKGPKGDTGPANAVTSSKIEYQLSTSGTAIPTGAWSTSVPTLEQGKYLWTRTTITYSAGNPSVSYSVAFQGRDGSFAGQDDINSLKEQMDTVYQLGAAHSEKIIKANDNLNDYLDFGTYACHMTTTAATIENCPIKTAFKLYVEIPTGYDSKGNISNKSTYIRQRIVSYFSDSVEYIRWRQNGTNQPWTEWTRTINNVPYDSFNSYGINLLRGTRDFSTGRNTIIGSGAYYTDGFRIANPNVTTLEKDSYGFTVATIEQHGLSDNSPARIEHSVFNVKNGDVITFTCEFMCENFSELYNDIFILTYELNDAGTSVKDVTYNYNELTDNADKVNGKWVKFRFVKTIESDKAVNLLIRFQMQRNGKVSIKKSCAQFGDITNPVWSASPFDVVERKEIESYEYEDEKIYFYKQGSVVYAVINGHVVKSDETGTQYLNTRIPAGLLPIKAANTFDASNKRLTFHTSGVIQTYESAESNIVASMTWICQ